jgi:hypothetical protein
VLVETWGDGDCILYSVILGLAFLESPTELYNDMGMDAATSTGSRALLHPDADTVRWFVDLLLAFAQAHGHLVRAALVHATSDSAQQAQDAFDTLMAALALRSSSPSDAGNRAAPTTRRLQRSAGLEEHPILLLCALFLGVDILVTHADTGASVLYDSGSASSPWRKSQVPRYRHLHLFCYRSMLLSERSGNLISTGHFMPLLYMPRAPVMSTAGGHIAQLLPVLFDESSMWSSGGRTDFAKVDVDDLYNTAREHALVVGYPPELFQGGLSLPPPAGEQRAQESGYKFRSRKAFLRQVRTRLGMVAVAPNAQLQAGNVGARASARDRSGHRAPSPPGEPTARPHDGRINRRAPPKGAPAGRGRGRMPQGLHALISARALQRADLIAVLSDAAVSTYLHRFASEEKLLHILSRIPRRRTQCRDLGELGFTLVFTTDLLALANCVAHPVGGDAGSATETIYWPLVSANACIVLLALLEPLLNRHHKVDARSVRCITQLFYKGAAEALTLLDGLAHCATTLPPRSDNKTGPSNIVSRLSKLPTFPLTEVQSTLSSGSNAEGGTVPLCDLVNARYTSVAKKFANGNVGQAMAVLDSAARADPAALAPPDDGARALCKEGLLRLHPSRTAAPPQVAAPPAGDGTEAPARPPPDGHRRGLPPLPAGRTQKAPLGLLDTRVLAAGATPDEAGTGHR